MRITIFLEHQKKWLEKFQDLLHIDATYRVNFENYALFIITCQDQKLKGILCGYCFMGHETIQNLDYMYTQMRRFCDPNRVKIIMVDKD